MNLAKLPNICGPKKKNFQQGAFQMAPTPHILAKEGIPQMIHV